MDTNQPLYVRRRILLMVFLTLLGFVAGFAWGEIYGSMQATKKLTKPIDYKYTIQQRI